MSRATATPADRDAGARGSTPVPSDPAPHRRRREAAAARRPRRGDRRRGCRGDGGRRRAAGRGRRRRGRPRAAAGRAGPVPRRLPAGPGRLRELPQAGPEAGRTTPSCARSAGSSRLLPVLDACDAALAHGAERGRAACSPRLYGALEQGGPRAHRPQGRGVRPRRRRGGGARAGRGRRAGGGRGAAHRLPLEGPGAAPGHGQGDRLNARYEQTRQSAMAPQREWFEKDYYRVLGVSDDASQKDIKSAYRKLVAPVPPRRQPRRRRRRGALQGGLGRLRRGRRRREAQGVRRGPQARAGGRQVRRRRRPGRGRPRRGRLPLRGRRRPRRPPRRPVRARAARRGRGRPGPGHRAPARARTSRPSSTSPSRTRVQRPHHDDPPHQRRGLLDLPRHRRRARAPTPHDVPAVRGPGRLDDNQGLFCFSPAVPRLRRPGLHRSRTRARPAGAPASSAGPARSRSASPPASADGQRIRLKGRGGPGRNGGPPGDLYVTVRVGPHPLFGRRGDDLTLTVPVTFPEAALGADVAVPTLDGGSVTLRIPAGTRSGRTLPGQGQGRRRPQEDRRPAGHRRGGRARRS